MAFEKERRRTKPFRDPKEHLFCSPQSARFSRQKGPAALDAPQGRIACRRQNMAQPCRTASPTRIWERTAAQYAPHTQRTQTPPHGGQDAAAHGSRLQRYMRYIINDLRRRPFFPPHMGCPARAPHPPLFRQTRQLSGCFRPPMRRLRAKMDAIAHARDNQPSVRRMPSIQAFGPAGALWPLPNPRLEHRPQLVRNPAFFSAAGKADAPLFYAR